MERKEELKRRLEQIKGDRFELAMRDIWFKGDFERDRSWREEQKRIEEELKQ